MKRNIGVILTALLFAFFLSGCPYGSKYPLTNPEKSQIDKSLLGKWDHSKDGVKDGFCNFIQFNDNEYYIELEEEGKPAVQRYRGFASIINGIKILNINSLDENNDGYVFAKYSIENGVLKLEFASDNYIKQKFDSQKKLRRFFTENITKEGFFETDGDFSFHRQ